MATIGTIRYRNGSNWVDILHPVGSFYLSTKSTSPSSLFGGTWVQITNAVLRGASGVGYGGSDTHTLTYGEMPSHNHSISLEGQGSMGGAIRWVGGNTGGYFSGSYIATAGEGQAFTELPRYYNLYVWYRSG